MSIGLTTVVQKLPSSINNAGRSIYAVNGKIPKLTLDFSEEYFRGGSGLNKFSDVVTHSRAGNATMVDSDGLLKWAPHNLLRYSENISAWTKFVAGDTVSVDSVVAPDGQQTADLLTFDNTTNNHIFRLGITAVIGVPYRFNLWVKSSAVQWHVVSDNFSLPGRVWVDTINGVLGTVQNATDATIIDYGNGWYLVSYTSLPAVATGPQLQYQPTTANGNTGATYVGDGSTTTASIWGAHAYRSDLGGMVDVPAGERSFPSASTYVPTTSAARYLPRVGHHVYNGSAWVNEGVLAESEARTNLLTYSSEFDNAAWSKSNVTVAANDTTAPDGTTTADAITESVNNNIHVTSQSATVSTAQPFTASVYVKANGRTKFLHKPISGSVSTSNTVFFDLTAETVNLQSTGWSASIQNVGNNWYRCSVTVSSGYSTGYVQIILLDASDNSVYAGDGTSGIYLWGAQVEEGSTPSSYIPTAGSTVTRAAETFTIPAANLPWPTETYGPELVTNGTFDTDISGWSAEVNASIALSSNALEVTETTGTTNTFSFAYQDITTVAGKVYVVSFDLVSTTDIAGVYVVRGTSNNLAANDGISGWVSASGTYTFTFTATVSGHRIALRTQGANSVSVFDNISVRELTRYPVSIQMNGRLSYADEGSAGQVTYAQWEDDTNNRITLSLDTDSTATGEVNFTQVEGGTADTVASSATEYTPGILVPFNIASRHGMTFINGAVDGVALTANTTPTNLPDLSATDLSLAYSYMGTVETFRVWGVDLADAGIALAATTAPSIYGLPTISGEINDPEVGETLAAVSAPVVLGAPTPSTTWQWLRDGLVILGATSSSYVLTNDDLGSKISVKQTITNAGGSAFSTSAETATVTGIPATATQQRDGAYIFDRANSYIEVRA